MPVPVSSHADDTASCLPDLLDHAGRGVEAAERLLSAARSGAKTFVGDGPVSGDVLDREQIALHGMAWYATYGEALRQMVAWGRRLEEQNRFGVTEALLLQVAFGEYLAQMAGGLPMNQGEIVRPADMGVSDDALHEFHTPSVSLLIREGASASVRYALAARFGDASPAYPFGDPGLDDTLDSMGREMRRFTDESIVPHAHGWHLADEYIPYEVIRRMADLGVFGLTIPEAHGGLGLGKESMCVVSEELSRGWIGVGSLGTRSEIAAELILGSGTPEQQQKFLPAIASGDILPTAVFTEPDTGSDLAALTTRATREGENYKVTGNKTWITHAARANLMTLLARTGTTEEGYRGLSMFLAEKPQGNDSIPFPAEGMEGSEIGVLGYRGMKEFEIAFDGFEVSADNLLGGVEGQGFKQLMRTFESARIQTAARAVGVAVSALESAVDYAGERHQFGKPIATFPRVAGKIALGAAEIMAARQIALFAAREKDSGRRCDLEAGMAKLLAARVAWSAADNAVQIHGGNGFALEYPVSRLLCDARILNIFEGAAEIQAHIIARRLLDGTN
ncbi:MAG: acyl-CoA dehydrogenase family protein [Parvularculales bacterium]